MKPQKFYFDDEEEGLARETSHPNFNAVVKEEFYFDCVDEFSPFGNDDGSDALASLTEWYQETRGRNKIVNWLFRHIDGFGYKYPSKYVARIPDIAYIRKIEQDDPTLILCMDRTIIGVGFGQYKITGSIDAELKQIVKAAIGRQKLLRGEGMLVHQADYGIIGSPVTDDAKLVEHYLERLSIMETDLAAFKEA